MSDHTIPPGWSYTLTAWRERFMLVGGALIGSVIAVYLALYQLGVLTSVWEPFLGSSSRDVLHSKIAQSLPALDEVVVSLQFLRREHRLGASLWDAPRGRGGHCNNTPVSE